MISLSFHGAAGTVTGSKYLLKVNDHQVMIDCGLFQGPRELRRRNWDEAPFDASQINDVILTHAHIDHIGYLPKLVRDGFNGTLWATPPTIDIAAVSLADTAHIMEEDAEYRNKRGLTRHHEAVPLFGMDDVEATMKLFDRTTFCDWIKLSDNIKFRFHKAGHILGAASVELIADDGEKERSILFSGDVGRYAVPLIVDPDQPPETDYLICESTYGGHIHEPIDPFFAMAELIDDIIARKAVLLIPSFAIGRTQQIVYMINTLIRQERIPEIDIHIDSPMSVKATDIYRKYKEYHAIDGGDFEDGDKFLEGKNVHLHRKRKSSKLLNKIKGPAIIISASGMLTGGRIMHHLLNRLDDENTTLALVGFMAAGTLGRKILDGDRHVYIHKQPIEVKAKVIKMMALSGHADYYEIDHWLEPVAASPKRVFITHGEPEESAAMAAYLTEKHGWNCHIPILDEAVELT